MGLAPRLASFASRNQYTTGLLLVLHSLRKLSKVSVSTKKACNWPIQLQAFLRAPKVAPASAKSSTIFTCAAPLAPNYSTFSVRGQYKF